jgi:hypothetical protein
VEQPWFVGGPRVASFSGYCESRRAWPKTGPAFADGSSETRTRYSRDSIRAASNFLIVFMASRGRNLEERRALRIVSRRQQ